FVPSSFSWLNIRPPTASTTSQTTITSAVRAMRLPCDLLTVCLDDSPVAMGDNLGHSRRNARSPARRVSARAGLRRDSGWWSWGESNPRPALSLHAFSGRSLCERSARPRPLSQTPKSTGPVWEESRVTSRRRHTARFLDDARIRVGISHGLTDYRARLCSEGEVVALCIGNYWFAGSVHEITLHPRPASRGFTGAVETDQPRGPSCEGTAVTLWNYQLGCRNTRASQDTTDREHTLFLA